MDFVWTLYCAFYEDDTTTVHDQSKQKLRMMRNENVIKTKNHHSSLCQQQVLVLVEFKYPPSAVWNAAQWFARGRVHEIRKEVTQIWIISKCFEE